MDGPHNRPARPLHVDHSNEQTRLQRQLLVAAYERICPVLRRTLPGETLPRRAEPKQRSLASPKMAAGACS